ncbi:DUF1599 domain containing protein [Elysia marginata]|uniref:DUF1599 domain containing protein n=1 Tax=Elysia marginata TaxID=1093978 RepID=A0AAV4GPU0_9GAST|nr:DUF1599 domain containing protein [Elysia marginata]
MKDYGSAWRILRLPSLTDQISIKTQRIRQLQKNHLSKIDESESVEFYGIINYCVMALIQIDLGIAETPDLDENEVKKHHNYWIEQTKKLMLDKNHDYGEAWRTMRISSITDLIMQKILRIKKIEDNNGKTLISEGVESNYQDIINYAIFALILTKTKSEKSH